MKAPYFSKTPALTKLVATGAFWFCVTSLRADYPIASHRFLADPAALVAKDRVYVYCSNDDDNPVGGGYVISNIVCVSSTDLKNWTDHGIVFNAPTDTTWAKKSWAPAAIERDGKYFLYYGNGGSNIGVATAASPVGPFTDPLGKWLIDAKTPGVMPAENMWLFDPAAFIDDDGQAYLYFGGNGEDNVRVIKLGRDMISLDGPALAVHAPNFFEASWMHKRKGVYYFSYSSNPKAEMRIDYMMGDRPMGPFTYRGVVAAQPPINDNNNHASIFEYKGRWYHAYHNRVVAKEAGIPTAFRRNLALDQLEYKEDGTIAQVRYTTEGVTQISLFNPYERVEAETFNAQHGVKTERCSAGGMELTSLDHGDWVKIKGVGFGGKGAREFSARVASGSSGGKVELHLGAPDGTLIGACTVTNTGGWQSWKTVTCSVAGAVGTQDLYLVFTGAEGPLMNVDYWEFIPRTD